MTTVAKLARDLFEEWCNEDPERVITDATKSTAEQWIRDVGPDSVPSATTVLFGMVVEDNSLAFLDGPLDDSTPFNVLQGAVQQEVERLALDLVNAYIDERIDERIG